MSKKNKLILIIEDDPVLLKALKKQFIEEEYDIITASNGEEAIKKTIKNKPDLLILDLLLPKVNGLQVLSTIGMMKEFKGVPILVLSILKNEAIVKYAKKLGASYYYIKSEVNLSDVSRRIGNIFKKNNIK